MIFLLLFSFAYFSFNKHIIHEHIRERKEIPNDIKLLTLHFCYTEVYRCHFIIGRQQWWNSYLCLSLKIFESSSKRVIQVLSIRDYLIVLITNTSHKAHLLSCAKRCSFKLQKIQSLENFDSMAIQGTQVPMYINTHWFCIFQFFKIFIIFLYEKKKLKRTQIKTN